MFILGCGALWLVRNCIGTKIAPVAIGRFVTMQACAILNRTMGATDGRQEQIEQQRVARNGSGNRRSSRSHADASWLAKWAERIASSNNTSAAT